jgi:hypothetical protein
MSKPVGKTIATMRNFLIIGTIVGLVGATTVLGQSSGEKKIRGCVTSRNSQYLLEEKQTKKEFLLAGSSEIGSREIAAYIGHAVTVHGAFASGSNAGRAHLEPNTNFVVTSIADSGSCTSDRGKVEQASNANAKPSPYRK